MFGDEADREQSARSKFFVYGGAFIPPQSASQLHNGVETIRNKEGFAATDSFKFAANTKPPAMSKESHARAKQHAMQLAFECGVKFCAYAILHKIAVNKAHDELVLFGVNTVIAKFHQFLEEQNGIGYAFLDRLPVQHPYRYLAEKFQTGLKLESGKSIRLPRIIGYASACDGSTHFSSVADIILGSFRYCVNEPDRDIAGKALFPQVAKLMWQHKSNGVPNLREYGLVLRPTVIKVHEHRAEYDSLSERLASYLAKQ